MIWPLEVQKVSKRGASGKIAERFIAMVGLESVSKSLPERAFRRHEAARRPGAAPRARPTIMLMDEPFGALDAQNRELLQEELQQIWDTSRKTVLFVTHDIDEAIYLADRVIVFTARPGRIKADIRDRSAAPARHRNQEDARNTPNTATTSGTCCAKRCCVRGKSTNK